MGADDDADCVRHEWSVAELALVEGKLERVEQCTWCPAVRYLPAPDLSGRPPL